MMLACQMSDEAICLRQHGLARARCPEQHAARTDKALIGSQHDIAATDQALKLGLIEAAILDAELKVRVKGGEVCASFVEAAAQRLARSRVLQRPVLSSWQALLDYCHTAMAHRPTEQFRVLYLDRVEAQWPLRLTNQIRRHHQAAKAKPNNTNTQVTDEDHQHNYQLLKIFLPELAQQTPAIATWQGRAALRAQTFKGRLAFVDTRTHDPRRVVHKR